MINRTMAAIALALVLIGTALFGAYMHGASVTQAKADLAIAKLNQGIADQRTAHAKQLADVQAEQREKEQANQENMTVIDEKHQKEMNDEITSRDSTIAGLRSGAIGLRDKFTSCQRSAHSAAGAFSIATGSSDAAASIELRNEDAEFLIRLGTEADQVADQLRACQAIIKSERADGKGPSKP